MIFISTYFACVFSYPWAVTIREMVELWPKEKGGVCTWDNNYRKAAVWVRISILKYKSYLLKNQLWYHEFGTNYFPGFINNYFWRTAPMLATVKLFFWKHFVLSNFFFQTLWVADSLGIFTYWGNDPYAGAGTNTWEDVFS